MGEIQAASSGTDGHEAGDNWDVADKWSKQYYGFRGSCETGYPVHYELEYGVGLPDIGEDGGGAGKDGWGDVK